MKTREYSIFVLSFFLSLCSFSSCSSDDTSDMQNPLPEPHVKVTGGEVIVHYPRAWDSGIQVRLETHILDNTRCLIAFKRSDTDALMKRLYEAGIKTAIIGRRYYANPEMIADFPDLNVLNDLCFTGIRADANDVISFPEIVSALPYLREDTGPYNMIARQVHNIAVLYKAPNVSKEDMQEFATSNGMYLIGESPYAIMCTKDSKYDAYTLIDAAIQRGLANGGYTEVDREIRTLQPEPRSMWLSGDGSSIPLDGIFFMIEDGCDTEYLANEIMPRIYQYDDSDNW